MIAYAMSKSLVRGC